MKTKKICMVLIAMLLVGVQGYAQPRHHHHRPVYHHPVSRPMYHRPYYRPMPSYYYWHPTYRYYYYTPLSVYWWGDSWDMPTKIQVECLEFKRTASGRLRIKNGTEPKIYLSMYDHNFVEYICPSGTVVEVTTGNGRTNINVRGNGNSASYTL